MRGATLIAQLALPLLALALLGACDGSTSTTSTQAATQKAAIPKAALPQAVKLHGEIFASEWHVTLIAREPTALARAASLRPAIEAALVEVERQLSLWQRDSELARFNRTAWTRALPVSPGLGALIATCLDVGTKTDGAFDITIGPLLEAWGFSAAQKGKVTEPPSAERIAAAKARTGIALLHVGGGGLTKDRPDLVVDVTSVGDGAAAAAVMAVLRERGFGDALVDVAGEVVVAGQGLTGPWKVGVNVPAQDAAPDAVEVTVPLTTAGGQLRALSTSGTYREAFTSQGRRYPHILDPATGAPVTHDLVSCTIVADDVVIADALSTACVALGEERTRAVLPRFAGASALFLTAQPLVPGAAPTFVSTTTAGFPPLQ